mgnify:CR=1 FL=1
MPFGGATDGLPPPQPGFAMAEIDAIEAELCEVTPHIAVQLSNLFDMLKDFGLTTRHLIAQYVATQPATAEFLCKSALAGAAGDCAGVDVTIAATALVTRLGQVDKTSTAPRGSSAGEPTAKRPKKEAWLGGVEPTLGPASALVALPPHLVEEAARIQQGRDQSRPLTVADAQSWVDSCRLWSIKNGIVNHEDQPGVLKKVCRPTHPAYLRPHRPHRHPALDRLWP